MVKKEKIFLTIIFVLGLLLRLLPGPDRWSWIYDQARDAYVIRSIISEKNLVLVGPQTDYPGLNHGPLSYYLLAPFYFLAHGDPNLPGLFMISLNLSSILPLYLLTKKLFNRQVAYLSIFLFAISYAQIEYARWIFNFSVAIPLLLWSYYFFIKDKIFAASLFLGLAIQGEIFLLYLLPLYLISKFRKLAQVLLGVALGLSPLILAEFKFNFIASRTFVTGFLGGHGKDYVDASYNLWRYLDHLGTVMKFTGAGLSYPMGLLALIILLVFIALNYKNKLQLVLLLFFSHAILFTFHFPDKVFLDFAVFLPLYVLIAYALFTLYKLKYKFLAALILLGLIAGNVLTLRSNLANKTLFDGYHFTQQAMFFSSKLEILDQVYSLVGEDEYSFSVLGTPYGVRTVWASVFEQYLRRHPEAKKPVWHGFAANGYPADDFFSKSDALKNKHILIIEQNQDLISPYIREEFLAEQNSNSQVVTEKELYGYKIQLREKISN